MKTNSSHFRHRFLFYATLLCIFCIPRLIYAIEPIATIGQPTPEYHAFLTNKTIVRAVSTHFQIVDGDTGAVIDEFANITHEVRDVVFSANASHFAIQNYYSNPRRYTIQIWDVNAREQISEWQVENNYQFGAFSPTQPLFVTSIDDEIFLWNWKTGKRIGNMAGERRRIRSCAIYTNPKGTSTITRCTRLPRDNEMVFTPDGKQLFIGSQRPDIEVWNIETRELVGHFQGEHKAGWVDGLAINSNGTRIASFESISGTIYVWDVGSRQLLWKSKNGIGEITDIAFSQNSQHLYVSTTTVRSLGIDNNHNKNWDDKVRVWDVDSAQQIDTFNTEFHGLDAIYLSLDGDSLLLQYADDVVLWDIEKKEPLYKWSDFIGWKFLIDVNLSPNGKTVAVLSEYGLKMWNVATQQMDLLTVADGFIYHGMAISPDNHTVAIGKDQRVEILDSQTGQVVAILIPPFNEPVKKMIFSPSGRWLAVSDGYRELTILDTTKQDNLKNPKLEAHPIKNKGFTNFVFSEKEEYFVASKRPDKNNNYKYPMQLWKRQVDKFVFQYAWEVQGEKYSPHPTPTFTTTPDGNTLLAASAGENIYIWRLDQNHAQLIKTLNNNSNETKLYINEYGPLKFTPDGHYLITPYQIWDWKANRPINNPALPNYEDISQDGSVLLSYTETGQYQIWDIKDILSFLPYTLEPQGKKFVTLGQIKRNQLLQNFPNPFNPETWIPFRITDESDVTIDIYTPTGKLVRTQSLGMMVAGDYTSQSKAVYWDGRNNNGERISSGVYLYTIKAGDFSATRKMLIQK